MIRGSIFWVNLEPSTPPEFGKIRPAIIVSNSEQNHLLPTVVVVPLSSKPPALWPLRVKISGPKKKSSFAIVPGIRQIDKRRLLKEIWIVSHDELEGLSHAISCYLRD